MDIEGSFFCICRDGYAGSGTVCMSKCIATKIHVILILFSNYTYSTCPHCVLYSNLTFPIPDVNECADDTDNCHANADCTDNVGSFSCMCSTGYSGDGVENCTGT